MFLVSEDLITKSLFKTYYYLINCMNNFQKTDASIIDAIRKKGYKATPQRIAICRYALRSRDHPTAQRIYEEVKKSHPTVSLATVYKTLKILMEHGLIQELNLPEGRARFDSYIKPHINLICLRCHNIQDLDDSSAQEIVERTAAKAEFTPTRQCLNIYGICKTCLARVKS
jgi:Fur family peroxide stress response transcriptional regulator